MSTCPLAVAAKPYCAQSRQPHDFQHNYTSLPEVVVLTLLRAVTLAADRQDSYILCQSVSAFSSLSAVRRLCLLRYTSGLVGPAPQSPCLTTELEIKPMQPKRAYNAALAMLLVLVCTGNAFSARPVAACGGKHLRLDVTPASSVSSICFQLQDDGGEAVANDCRQDMPESRCQQPATGALRIAVRPETFAGSLSRLGQSPVFSLRCPVGTYITAVYGHAEDLLDQLAIECSDGSSPPPIGEPRGLWGAVGRPFRLSCPQGFDAARGADMWNSVPTQLGLRCSEGGRWSATVASLRYRQRHTRTLACPRGHVLVGFNGRAGGHIVETLVPVCQAPSVKSTADLGCQLYVRNYTVLPSTEALPLVYDPVRGFVELRRVPLAVGTTVCLAMRAREMPACSLFQFGHVWPLSETVSWELTAQGRDGSAACHLTWRGESAVPMTCHDGVWNGGETDVDCGEEGGCRRCERGSRCANSDDCAGDLECMFTEEDNKHGACHTGVEEVGHQVVELL